MTDPGAYPVLWAVVAALLIAIPAGAAAAWSVGRFASDDAPSLLASIGVCAAVFAWGALVAAGPLDTGATLALGWCLICLAAVDLLTLRLPDAFTLPLSAVGLGLAAVRGWSVFPNHLAGAVLGYAVFSLLALAWRAWRGVDALGKGDAKLLAAAGAWLGWRPLPSVLLIASLAALAFAGGRALLGRRALERELAFGPFLALGFWLAWLYGASPMSA
ncbi:MAG TPA: A24 family peptidase [Caulobacteraceae bacterium]|nr:A24 family peptidase [Caulobacteraceae bacterium]